MSGDYCFSSGEELIGLAERHGLSIAEVQRECERSVRDDAAIDSALDRVFHAMDGCAKAVNIPEC